MRKEIFILDACALIAFFNDELGADKVEKLFKNVINEEAEIFLHAVNLFEVYYDCWKIKGKGKADELLLKVKNLPIVVERRFSDVLLLAAGYFKVNEKVSLADSVALGLAKIKKASVISSDHHEFDILENKKLIKFLWIR